MAPDRRKRRSITSASGFVAHAMGLASCVVLASACDGDPIDDDANAWEAVPDIPYCVGAADWDPQWTELEEQILARVNDARAHGADCRTAGNFPATTPLRMDPALRCAARLHSADMAARDYFEHDDPDGGSPFERIEDAGYTWSTAGENIAAGSPDAAGTMAQWMGSDGHCSNIMNPGFDDIGVGYHPGGAYGHLWTQTFGAP